jgi:hypothetical protein
VGRLFVWILTRQSHEWNTLPRAAVERGELVSNHRLTAELGAFIVGLIVVVIYLCIEVYKTSGPWWDTLLNGHRIGFVLALFLATYTATQHAFPSLTWATPNLPPPALNHIASLQEQEDQQRRIVSAVAMAASGVAAGLMFVWGHLTIQAKF